LFSGWRRRERQPRKISMKIGVADSRTMTRMAGSR
jgi:hypothetical protein